MDFNLEKSIEVLERTPNVLYNIHSHDLNHISQISRVIAKQYKEAVGPWAEYIGILHM